MLYSAALHRTSHLATQAAAYPYVSGGTGGTGVCQVARLSPPAGGAGDFVKSSGAAVYGHLPAQSTYGWVRYGTVQSVRYSTVGR